MRNTWNVLLVALVVIVLLAGCSGSGGGGDGDATVIGPLGGTATSEDGNCSAQFPPGALDEMTEITIDPSGNAPAHEAKIANTAYTCGPAGLDFQTAVTLTIKYDPDAIPVGVDEEELDIARLVGGVWQRIPNSVADPGANEVSCLIAGFSTFAILGSPLVGPEQYVFDTEWGEQGTASSEFGPMGGIAYQAGTVYVTDMVPTTTERIQRFDDNGGFLGQCQGWDPKAGASAGIYVDHVADIYTSIAGDVFTKIGPFCNPIFARDAADLGLASFRPSDAAMDSVDNIFCADMVNSQIFILDPAGAYLNTIGGYGTADGQFNGVGGIAITHNDRVYASDHLGDRIQELDTNGLFVNAWGTTGEGEGEFHAPRGLDVDQDGNVYVADSVNNRVQKFDANGNFITEFGEPGSDDGEFQFPTDVAVHGDGSTVYVLDVLNYRVQKFVRVP